MHAQEHEQEAVRTTIVGGRPPGSGRTYANTPRAIEVLMKKAAVDPEFRELLLEQRGRAAAAIELKLDPAENAMLRAIPREQLAQIISQTSVPPEHRRVFLGRVATAMLAVLGVGLTGCGEPAEPAGIRPDTPDKLLATADATMPTSATLGVRPYSPQVKPGDLPLKSAHNPLPVGESVQPDRPPAKSAPITAPAAFVDASRGIRPDRPNTSAPSTNQPLATKKIQPDHSKTYTINVPVQGIRPDRP